MRSTHTNKALRVLYFSFRISLIQPSADVTFRMFSTCRSNIETTIEYELTHCQMQQVVEQYLCKASRRLLRTA